MSQVMEEQLYAFNNNQKLKEFITNRVLEHQNADEIIKDAYWENGSGCAIGCVTHSNSHADFEEIGIPEWIARLIEIIHVGLESKDAKLFPYRIISAIPTGLSDWKSIYHNYNHYLLDEICVYGRIVKKEMNTIKKLHKERETSTSIWNKAYTAAHVVEHEAYKEECSTHLASHLDAYSVTHATHSAIQSAMYTAHSVNLVGYLARRAVGRATQTAIHSAAYSIDPEYSMYLSIHPPIHSVDRSIYKKISKKLIRLVEMQS